MKNRRTITWGRQRFTWLSLRPMPMGGMGEITKVAQNPNLKYT